MPRPRIPERRNRLIDAATQLALAKGWRTTTVSDIAVRAGIGKGAVYLEFDDKSAILEAAILRSMQQLTRVVHARVSAVDGLVTLAMLYGFAVDALLDDRLMRALYLGDESVLGDHVRGVSDDRYRLRFTWMLDYIGGCQRAGMISPDLPGDTVARMLSTFTIGLLHTPDTLGPITDDQLRASVALFADLVDRSITTAAPIDPDAARTLHITLLDTLAAQLDQQKDQP